MERIIAGRSASAQGSPRHELVSVALRLSYLTIAWNGAIGSATLAASVVSDSLALAGLALNALLDSCASCVLVWRFRKERRDPAAAERSERHAQALIAVALLVVALYLGIGAVRVLLDGAHASESVLGIVLAAVSLAVLPWLGRSKLRIASRLGSRALRGDGVLTLAAAALAAITLAALLLASALGWWWADPLAALVIVLALAVEAVRIAIHHRFG
jgi:divalent metal cation (Fe/Co/Zn/Cd) transporter